MELVEKGVLDAHGVEVIGARPDAIATAEDRERFRDAMHEIGLRTPDAGLRAHARRRRSRPRRVGFPVMIRPSFILGGLGTGIAKDLDALRADGATRASRRARSARSSSSGRSRAGRSSSSR